MNKVYACSDLHGMYNLWEQIKNYCDETDKIYFLGDAADRGPEGFKMMLELLGDERVTYLKGNHEDMFSIVMSEYIKEDHLEHLQWWMSNGGSSTFSAAKEREDNVLLSLIHIIDKLPEFVIYESPKGHKVFLSHAGTDLNYNKSELEYMGRKNPYIWDRRHFYAEHPADMPEVYQVHGHTPVEYLCECLYKPYKNEVVSYCDGHKYDIDLGAFYTCKTALIDLDTFEVKYFFDEETFKKINTV